MIAPVDRDTEVHRGRDVDNDLAAAVLEPVADHGPEQPLDVVMDTALVDWLGRQPPMIADPFMNRDSRVLSLKGLECAHDWLHPVEYGHEQLLLVGLFQLGMDVTREQVAGRGDNQPLDL